MPTNKLKIINDPVYGFITIPDALVFDVIEHPWFQRLRRILPMPKQAMPIMLLAVGVPGERAIYNPRLRFPLEQCVSWH